MPDPLNPLNSPDPLDDPMLDAVERSIENPPGFEDPLAERDDIFMDGLGKQLCALEDNVENSPSMVPMAPPAGGPPVDLSAYRLPNEETDPLTNDNATPAATHEEFGTFASRPPLPEDGLTRTPPPNPPESRMLNRGGGAARRKKRLPVQRDARSRKGPTMIRPNDHYCLETHEIINSHLCEDCEKLRHWPEGSTEDPRECWYDWQAARSATGSDEGEGHDG